MPIRGVAPFTLLLGGRLAVVFRQPSIDISATCLLSVGSVVVNKILLRHIHRITERVCSRTLRSSATPPLVQPFIGTTFPDVLSRFQHRLSGTPCHNSSGQQLSDAMNN